jgi:hypothetical protein
MNDPVLSAFLGDLTEDCPEDASILSCYTTLEKMQEIEDAADLTDELPDGRRALSFLCLGASCDHVGNIVRVFTQHPTQVH